jgi:hypothetical protein
MLRILTTLLSLPLFLISLSAPAASQIELIDGTIIHGDLISLTNGRFTIRSTTLGHIRVPESKIKTIRPGGSGAVHGAPQVNTATPTLERYDFQAIQKQITSSPELMQMVYGMMSDPELQAAMNDPQLVQLVMSGDMEALQRDPRIRHLMTKPSIRAMMKKMSRH